MRKISSLCESFPTKEKQYSPLDNIAGTIFWIGDRKDFVQSNKNPTNRYRLEINPKDLEGQKLHYNPVINNFDYFGPNEKFLVNKIFHASRNLLYIVGGIGVGKTHFMYFFMDSVIPNYILTTEFKTYKKPVIVYLNFLDDTGFDIERGGKKPKKIKKRIIDKKSNKSK